MSQRGPAVGADMDLEAHHFVQFLQEQVVFLTRWLLIWRSNACPVFYMAVPMVKRQHDIFGHHEHRYASQLT